VIAILDACEIAAVMLLVMWQFVGSLNLNFYSRAGIMIHLSPDIIGLMLWLLGEDLSYVDVS